MDRLRFEDAAGWEAWLADNHQLQTDAWLQIAKKGSGIASITVTEALDVALCYGWIDAQRRGHDDTWYLQRYCRRRPKSTWSQVNVAKVAALEAAGRMQPAGLAEVAAAKADGRWAAAYEAQRTAQVPADLAAALAERPEARAAFDRLGRSDQYSVILPLLKVRTAQGRSAAIARAIERLTAAQHHSAPDEHPDGGTPSP